MVDCPFMYMRYCRLKLRLALVTNPLPAGHCNKQVVASLPMETSRSHPITLGPRIKYENLGYSKGIPSTEEHRHFQEVCHDSVSKTERAANFSRLPPRFRSRADVTCPSIRAAFSKVSERNMVEIALTADHLPKVVCSERWHCRSRSVTSVDQKLRGQSTSLHLPSSHIQKASILFGRVV